MSKNVIMKNSLKKSIELIKKFLERIISIYLYFLLLDGVC